MSDLTDDQVRALLDEATPGSWRADGEPWNRVVWSSADNRVCFMSHSNGLNDERDIATSNLAAAAPDLARALLQARADAAAAQAALEDVTDPDFIWDVLSDTIDIDVSYMDLAKAVSAKQRENLLAPDAGTAKLAKLRVERDEAVSTLAYCEKQWTDTDRVTHAKMLDERAERDALAASLAQANLRAKNAYMRGLLDSAQHLRSTIPDNPDSWEQIESMAQMLDAMATREAAKAVLG